MPPFLGGTEAWAGSQKGNLWDNRIGSAITAGPRDVHTHRNSAISVLTPSSLHSFSHLAIILLR